MNATVPNRTINATTAEEMDITTIKKTDNKLIIPSQLNEPVASSHTPEVDT